MLRLSDVASAIARSDAAEASRHLAAVEIEDFGAEDRRSLHYVKQNNEDGDTIVLMVSASPPRRPF